MFHQISDLPGACGSVSLHSLGDQVRRLLVGPVSEHRRQSRAGTRLSFWLAAVLGDVLSLIQNHARSCAAFLACSNSSGLEDCALAPMKFTASE